MGSCRLPENRVDEHWLNEPSFQRFGEIIALAILAPQRTQLRKLHGCFYSFGNHAHAQVVRQKKNDFDNFLALGNFGDVVDKRSVNFECVERKAVQVAERGVSGAEIINGRAPSEATLLAERERSQNGLIFSILALLATVQSPLLG